MSNQVDVVVIGMGIGGEAVAGTLAEAGLTVVGVDQGLVGGECPYWGCIPSKMMIRAAGLIAEARRIPGMAGEAIVTPDYAPVAARIRAEATDNWDDTVAVDRFVDKGGRFVRGSARVTGPHTVAVEGEEFEWSRALVIAGGTTAAVPPIAGLDQVDYWTNHEAIEAKEAPASLVVLGGGAIGLELAQSFARFGSSVTVVEALDRLLPLEEPEAGEIIEAALREDGVHVRTAARAVEVGRSDGGIDVTLEDGTVVTGEHLLVAVGRRTHLAALGVSALGLDESARFLDVDERLRTGAAGVYAVGDITGAGLFTHVAAYQAGIAAADILGEESHAADYRALPRVTFTDPEVGAVGLSEADARSRGLNVRVGLQPVPHSARGWLHKAGNEGVIKLVEDADRGVLVGATSVGPHGGEVLGLLSLAVHAEVPVETMARMIYAYPTFHRGIEDALKHLA